MWLNPDFARALLLVGLLLSAIALGGEQASRYVVAAEPAIETTADGSAAVTINPRDYRRIC